MAVRRGSPRPREELSDLHLKPSLLVVTSHQAAAAAASKGKAGPAAVSLAAPSCLVRGPGGRDPAGHLSPGRRSCACIGAACTAALAAELSGVSLIRPGCGKATCEPHSPRAASTTGRGGTPQGKAGDPVPPRAFPALSAPGIWLCGHEPVPARALTRAVGSCRHQQSAGWRRWCWLSHRACLLTPRLGPGHWYLRPVPLRAGRGWRRIGYMNAAAGGSPGEVPAGHLPGSAIGPP